MTGCIAAGDHGPFKPRCLQDLIQRTAKPGADPVVHRCRRCPVDFDRCVERADRPDRPGRLR